MRPSTRVILRDPRSIRSQQRDDHRPMSPTGGSIHRADGLRTRDAEYEEHVEHVRSDHRRSPALHCRATQRRSIRRARQACRSRSREPSMRSEMRGPAEVAAPRMNRSAPITSRITPIAVCSAAVRASRGPALAAEAPRSPRRDGPPARANHRLEPRRDGERVAIVTPPRGDQQPGPRAATDAVAEQHRHGDRGAEQHRDLAADDRPSIVAAKISAVIPRIKLMWSRTSRSPCERDRLVWVSAALVAIVSSGAEAP